MGEIPNKADGADVPGDFYPKLAVMIKNYD
jgi:hypothetical protein